MVHSKELETCTEKCKDEQDMQCINECGTEYMRHTAVKYDGVLTRFKAEMMKI